MYKRQILVSLYVADGLPVDFILLGVAHFVSLGKRSARYIERALLGWQAEGIDTVEAAERYLKPVSYTHLDVYKRQSRACALGPGL